ncbi:MAG: D-alanine--D-alanine ligase family protein [Bacteroidota bacterium]
MSKLRIGVIFGGRSGEHEVSLVSAGSVINALDRAQYDVVPIGITQQGRWVSSGRALDVLKAKTGIDGEPERFLVPEPNRRGLVSLDSREALARIDVIFPVLHGTYGEDGTIQGLLELANIPYVGAGVLGSALGMDKIVQKQLFEQAGLPIARYLWFVSSVCQKEPKRVVAAAEKKLKYPMFTKPANTGSSVGISKAHHRSELLAGIAMAAQYDRKIVIEQGVNSLREIECSVLGNDEPFASVTGEIIPSNEFYDYDAKYVDGKSEAVVPADLPKKVMREIQKLAIEAFRVLDCAGMARVDFFVTKKKHRIYLNEINTIPGFTSISMYPKLWEASGISYPALLDKLISLALERHAEKNNINTTYNPTRDWYKG